MLLLPKWKSLLLSTFLFLSAPIDILLTATAAAANEETTADEMTSMALEEAFKGTWIPVGRGYEVLGDLSISEQTLSWGTCVNSPYAVLRSEGRTYLVQFLLANRCKVDGEAAFLILKLTERGLDASICRDPHEFDKPMKDRYCSNGILVRKIQ